MEASQNNWPELLMKYLKRTISAEELQELERQKAASALKQAQFDEFTDRSLFQRDLRKMYALQSAHTEKHPAAPWFKSVRLRWSAAAAVLLLMAGIVYLTTRNTAPTDPYLELTDGSQINLKTAPNGRLTAAGGRFLKDNNKLIIETSDNAAAHTTGASYTVFNPAGGDYAVQLPDESSVQLNAASYLRLPAGFNRKWRQVETGGEAYMEITRDSLSPFTVTLGEGKEVSVKGTQLNISAYKGEPARVSLLKGKVIITTPDGQSPLEEGQEAVLQGDSIHVTKLANAEQTVSWTKHMFDFTDVDIRTAFRALEHHYGVKTQFAERFPDKIITALFPWRYGLDSILNSLEISYHIQVIRKQHTLIVSSTQ